jgi:predicted nucleotidyltransferase
MTTLTPDQVRGALALLNEKLLSRETQGELCLFGGAVMALVFDARPSTRDVDAIMVPKAELLEASAEVALEMGLREDWLNDGVKGFVSSQPELTADGLPMFMEEIAAS